jgi:hypothetical protein
MNAVYGKFAQMMETRVRTKKVDGRSEIFDGRVWRVKETWTDHTSFVYAAEITSQIRIKLIEDLPPEKVISYSTDGVFTTEPVTIATGPGLGEWSEVEKVRDLIVVGSGVYTLTNEEGERIVKFRGFSPQIDLRKMLEKAGRRHSIGMAVLRNTSLRVAAKRQTSKAMNVLMDETRYMDVNFDQKRFWSERWNARDLTCKQFDSMPWVYYPPVKLRR